MMNLKEVPADRERSVAPWRSIGGVTAGLLARAEARREEVLRADETAFVPVAWAAE